MAVLKANETRSEVCVKCCQAALQCDNCLLWSHTACVGVNNQLYKEFQTKTEFSWQCPSCLFAILPNLEVHDINTEIEVPHNTLPSTIDGLTSSFNGIRIVHHNIQGMHSKMIEISQWTNESINKNVIFCFSEIWISPQSPPINVKSFHTFFLHYIIVLCHQLNL